MSAPLLRRSRTTKSLPRPWYLKKNSVVVLMRTASLQPCSSGFGSGRGRGSGCAPLRAAKQLILHRVQLRVGTGVDVLDGVRPLPGGLTLQGGQLGLLTFQALLVLRQRRVSLGQGGLEGVQLALQPLQLLGELQDGLGVRHALAAWSCRIFSRSPVRSSRAPGAGAPAPRPPCACFAFSARSASRNFTASAEAASSAVTRPSSRMRAARATVRSS